MGAINLAQGTGLPVVKAEDPMATVMGAGKLLTDRELLSKVAVSVS
jgi:hypothetical protein